MSIITKYVLDPEGNPTPCDDVQAWAGWYESSVASQIVAQYAASDGSSISTTFTGLEPPGGERHLWETLICGGRFAECAQTYASLEEARTGHELWVVVVEASIKLGGEAGRGPA